MPDYIVTNEASEIEQATERLLIGLEELRVGIAAIRADQAKLHREIQRGNRRVEAIERAIEIPQTVGVKGAATLIGVSTDTVYQDKALRALAMTGSPLRWRRCDVLAEIDRRAKR